MMDQRQPSGSDDFERARDDQEPGSHSGKESRAQDRIIPGTASAREGYQTQGGTAHDEPLAGVEAGPEEPDEEPSGEEDEPGTSRGRRAQGEE